MEKLYKVNQYTAAQWDAYSDERETYDENTIDIVWHANRVCMDIEADGVRIIPILRKIERSMQAAGLAAADDEKRPAPFTGWFGAWADSLQDPTDRKYFVWSYDGRQDRENGRWSYSWGIEQVADNRWYVFLNLAI